MLFLVLSNPRLFFSSGEAAVLCWQSSQVYKQYGKEDIGISTQQSQKISER